jgi:hypothetical protein
MQTHAFPLRLFFMVLAGLSAIAIGAFPIPVSAQATNLPSAPAPQQPEENLGGQEAELVKPVIWSLREEYYNLQGGGGTTSSSSARTGSF